MDNGIELGAEEGDGASAPASTQPFQDAPKSTSSGGILSNKKYRPYLIGGGILIVFVIFTLVSKNNSATSTTTTNPVDSATASPPTGTSTVDTTGLQSLLQSNAQQNQASLDAMTQQLNAEQQSINQLSTNTNQSLGTLGQTVTGLNQSISGIQSTLSSHNTTATGSGATSAKSYSTINVPQGLSQTQLNQVAQSNAGSPVVQKSASGQQTGYAISKANQNGQLSTSSNYNQAVNKAGGQWINNVFYGGSYNNQGVFVTKTPSQQTVYNKNANVGIKAGPVNVKKA